MVTFASLEDLKLLSTALTQFVDNQDEIETEAGDTPDMIRARRMLEKVDMVWLERLLKLNVA